MRTYSEQQISDAATRSGLPLDQWQQLSAELKHQPETRASFQGSHLAIYFGGLLIMGAMGWFVTQAWDTLSGMVLTAIALLYAIVFGGAGLALSRRPAMQVPGGVLVTVAVAMVPLAVYGIERTVGWWPMGDPGGYAQFHPRIHGSWVLMEAVTIMSAALALHFVRFPFVLAPAAYALWYMSMDATSLIFGKPWNFHQQCWISIGFGVAMLLLGYFADGETELDFSFWFYLFGLLAFTGGLSLLGGGTQIGKLIYCLLHLLLMGLSIVLQRRAFVVFGAIGVFIYLTDEAWGFFKNSLTFSIGVTVIGIACITLGVLFKRHETALSALLTPFIPERVRHRHYAAMATAHEAEHV